MEDTEKKEEQSAEPKKVKIRTAIPLWAAAAVWLIGAFFPLYRIPVLILFALLSLLAAFIASKCVKPEYREETDEPEQKKEETSPTGNAELDENIIEINRVLDVIRESRRLIVNAHPVPAASMEGICEELCKIRKAILSSPSLLPKIRRMMNYYLPTTEKLCGRYVSLASQAESETILETEQSIEKALTQIRLALSRLYDSLFDDDALDISSDVKVLETIIARDGLDK